VTTKRWEIKRGEGENMHEIDLMKRGKYLMEDDTGSSVYHGSPKKGNMPIYKSIALDLGALAMILLPACGYSAGKAQNPPKAVAQKSAKAVEAKAEVQQQKRILIKDFKLTGEEQVETKYVGRTAHSGNEGAAIKAVIRNELINSQNSGKFNKKGLYSLVEDTEKPDSEEAEYAIKGTYYRAGGRVYFFAELDNTKTTGPIHVFKVDLPDLPDSIPLGGEFIAIDMNNYLQ